MFCLLLFWFSCHYLPSDWLERLLCGSLTVARDRLHKAQAEKCLWFSWFIVLFHCSISCLSCPPAVCDIFHTPMARYSLFVLKVPLNNNKPNQTLFGWTVWLMCIAALIDVDSDLIASMTSCAKCSCCCHISVLVEDSSTWHAISSCLTSSAHTVTTLTLLVGWQEMKWIWPVKTLAVLKGFCPMQALGL